MKKFWAVLTILSMFIGIDFSGKTVKVEDAWARATGSSTVSGSLYFTVNNKTDEDDALLGITSDVASSASIEEVVQENGAPTLHQMKAVTLAKGESKVFKPHVMQVSLNGLKHPLVEGETFKATFNFATKGFVEATVHVEQPNAMTYGP